MPFRKIGTDRYRSPSGKIMTAAQVRAYYAKKKRGKVLKHALGGKK